MDIAAEKKRLRREALARRAALSPEEIARASAAVVRRLEGLDAFREAEAIFSYVSLPIEIDTRALIHRCLAQDRTVYVPACRDDGSLIWCRLHDWHELVPGRHGILAPRNPLATNITTSKNTVCLVPGLLFDHQGHRLGYGGGYFDRFLADYEGLSVGLVSAQFLHPRLPWEEHDIAVGVVVTEVTCVNRNVKRSDGSD